LGLAVDGFDAAEKVKGQGEIVYSKGI